jgi:hypothetical protein
MSNVRTEGDSRRSSYERGGGLLDILKQANASDLKVKPSLSSRRKCLKVEHPPRAFLAGVMFACQFGQRQEPCPMPMGLWHKVRSVRPHA